MRLWENDSGETQTALDFAERMKAKGMRVTTPPISEQATLYEVAINLANGTVKIKLDSMHKLWPGGAWVLRPLPPDCDFSGRE